MREALQSDCPPTRCLARAGMGAAAIDNGLLVLQLFSISSNLGRIQREVVFRDNGVNLDAETLPLPLSPGYQAR